MKHKRLDRDKWGFQYFPYYQMRMDAEGFHGLASLICLMDGEPQYWQMPKAGKVMVAGPGMRWLQWIPDGRGYMLTAKYLPDGRVSVWYADMIDGVSYDGDGVGVFSDLYLDVIFSPQGDVKIDDRDELYEAYQKGIVTRAQYRAAVEEAAMVKKELCGDLTATKAYCDRLLKEMEKRIVNGEKPFKPTPYIE